MPETYNAAMEGRARAAKADAELRRDLAILSGYIAGAYSQGDLKKMPKLDKLLREFRPKQPLTQAEIIARLDRMADRGMVVKH